ncbi:unannotated protein [freshwater metagenome]|uniref:Unannotated protein n=1 Tax=freshwater metagenome TaxID=449393 RepID=A0A6J6LUM3_9ZZZZ
MTTHNQWWCNQTGKSSSRDTPMWDRHLKVAQMTLWWCASTPMAHSTEHLVTVAKSPPTLTKTTTKHVQLNCNQMAKSSLLDTLSLVIRGISQSCATPSMEHSTPHSATTASSPPTSATVSEVNLHIQLQCNQTARLLLQASIMVRLGIKLQCCAITPTGHLTAHSTKMASSPLTS